ncbi:MAG: hypothetical protein HY901_01210 [Deltaproteobacteria bacterium]|nr:hypothetical protein [Deltaproteobacteria bacterium]
MPSVTNLTTLAKQLATIGPDGRPEQTPKLTREDAQKLVESAQSGGITEHEKRQLTTVLNKYKDQFDPGAADLLKALLASPAPSPSPAPAASSQIKPIFYEGPATFTGAKFKPELLSGKFENLDPNKLGTTDVLFPQRDGTTKAVNVRDYHYELPEQPGKVGMHLIPVDNNAEGSAQMDGYLRKQMGLQPNEPIYALIAYIHPEGHSGSLKDLAGSKLKTEMGITHMGAYVGGGVTSNAPESYHSRSWGVENGYPCTAYQVSLDGVPQAELNKNFRLVDSAQNRQVEFPDDYKNDRLATYNLNSSLMFYRDWIKNEGYLKTENSWATYCAEHKTNVTNVGINLPHNEASFKEVFGEQEGADLWKSFTEKTYPETHNGEAWKPEFETHFEPLWKQNGLTAAQVRPFTKAEYDGYEKARFDGSLANGTYTGPKPLAPGVGMAWTPQSTADLVKNFVETYASFNKAGGFASAATVMSFVDTVKGRMGVDAKGFSEVATPILQKMMVAEAISRGVSSPEVLEGFAKEATGTLYVAFGGKAEDLGPGGTINENLMSLAKSSTATLGSSAGNIFQLAQGSDAARKATATNWLHDAIGSDLEKARNTAVSDASKVEFYSPPAVLERVINGMVPADKHVHIRALATAVSVQDVE